MARASCVVDGSEGASKSYVKEEAEYWAPQEVVAAWEDYIQGAGATLKWGEGPGPKAIQWVYKLADTSTGSPSGSDAETLRLTV